MRRPHSSRWGWVSSSQGFWTPRSGGAMGQAGSTTPRSIWRLWRGWRGGFPPPPCFFFLGGASFPGGGVAGLAGGFPACAVFAFEAGDIFGGGVERPVGGVVGEVEEEGPFLGGGVGDELGGAVGVGVGGEEVGGWREGLVVEGHGGNGAV